MSLRFKFEPIELSDIFNVEWYTGTGHAPCRICGEKIAKGGRGVSFWFSPADDEVRWYKKGKAHVDCLEADASGVYQQVVIDGETMEDGLLRFKERRSSRT